MSEELKGFDALLVDGEAQAEFDRRVNKAIEAARGKWEKDALARIEAARAEGAQAAGMSAEEKLQAREQELSGRERALSQRGRSLLSGCCSWAKTAWCTRLTRCPVG